MHDRSHDVIVYGEITLTHTDTHNCMHAHTLISSKLSSHKLQIVNHDLKSQF